ncbi:MAG TPA: hypothetical protein VNK49_11290 [Anaerolineales bacterium]|nr:hypothetical protein [Anaerolineales bacterium]
MNFDWISYLLPALCCFFMIGTVILAAIMGYLSSQKRDAAWQELAARNGLRFEPGGMFSYPSLSGLYRGHNLWLRNIRRTHGKKHARTYTRLVLSLNNRANIRFGLYDEDIFSGVIKALGVQDVRTGDETVDERFMIKSQPETFAPSLFASASLRERLLRVKPMNLTLEGNELVFEQNGMLTDTEQLQFLFDLLVDVADRVERG